MLVHQKEIGGQDQKPGQCHPRTLAAGEDGNALVHLIAAEKEGAQNAADKGLRLVGNEAPDFLENRPRRVEELGVVLGVIGQMHIGATA